MEIVKQEQNGQNLPSKAVQSNALIALLQGNIDSYLSIQCNLTPEKALNSPQISSLNKSNESDLLNAIKIALMNINDLCNLPKEKKLAAHQINYLAHYLKKEYWKFKFDEFVYILGQGIAGRFGKSYNRLDVEVVSDWFKVYDEKYFWQQRELAGYNQAANLKRQEKEKPLLQQMPEEVQQQFKELIKGSETEEIKQPTFEERIKEQKKKTDAELKNLLPSLTLPELKEMLNEMVLNENETQAEIIREFISDLLNDLKW